MTSAFPRVSAGPLVLAAAIPLVFLHVHYQPVWSIAAGATHVDVSLSDLAVLAVAVAAVTTAVTAGARPLRAGVSVWIPAAALLALVLVSVSYPLLRDRQYDWQAALVSALKFCEYAALAVSAPLLLRTRDDLRLAFRALVAWSAVATTVGILQFVGAVDEFQGKRPAQREPSILGIHDLAALSGAALAIAVVAVALAERDLIGRAWILPAAVSGGLGMVVSGAMTGVIGMWLAIAVLALTARLRGLLTRRALGTLALVGVLVTLGTAGMRGSALRDFAGFLGIHRNETPGAVESYSQRTLLAYIGLRIFADEAVTGVGYQGSSEPWAYEPQLAAARHRFPGQPAEAFPSPEHPWGVQNLSVQTLADLGLIGAAVLAALFACGLRLGLRPRSSPVALVGVAWILVAAGVWIGLGIVPGIPLAALTWLGFGLVSVRV